MRTIWGYVDGHTGGEHCAGAREHVLIMLSSCRYDRALRHRRSERHARRSDRLQRAAFQALALHSRRTGLQTVLSELTATVRLRHVLRIGRKRRAFCAWASLAVVVRWHKVHTLLRVLAVWKQARQCGQKRLERAQRWRREVLLGRAATAWKIFYHQARLLSISYSGGVCADARQETRSFVDMMHVSAAVHVPIAKLAAWGCVCNMTFPCGT